MARSSPLRAIVDSLADGVVVVTGDGIIRYANKAAEMLFQRAAAELVGSAFAHPLVDAEISIAGSEPGRGEMRVARIEWEGRPAHLATVRDITRRERLRALERRLLAANRRSAMAQLAAGIAHEINNPTAFILANLTVMKDIVADFDAAFAGGGISRKILDRYQIAQSLGDMRDMLEDNALGLDRIRTFVRELKAVAQEPPAHVAMIDVNEAVSLACDLAASVHAQVAPPARELGPVPAIAADLDRLAQAVHNLLDNAVDAIGVACAPGAITVTTACAGPWITVTVRDTGCGIPPEHLDRIFEPFFIARPGQRGPGMGLPIAAEIASSHGGRIEVDSTPGEGSELRLILPTDTGLPLSDHKRRAAPGRVRARVLLLAADPALSARIHQMLDPFHDVLDAADSEAARACVARARDHDVLLCDLASSAGDAMSLYRSLASSAPPLAARMVLLGAAAPSPRVKRFIESSRAMVIEGPLSGRILCEVIERMSR